MTQSNPATLREALKHLHSAAKIVVDFLPDGEYAGLGNLRFRMREAEEALAASGTEAAPIGELEKRRQYQATHARIQGGDDFDQDEPAGAAASPEGEGRSMNDLGPCGKHPRKIAETPAQAWHRAYESPNADKDPSQHCPECDRDAALRQSAAPSGGAIVTIRERLTDLLSEVNDLAAGYPIDTRTWTDLSTIEAELASIRDSLFAQESKTGAVTETK